EPRQHVFYARKYLVQVHDPGLQDLAPAEREKLSGQPGGSLAGFADFLEVRAEGIPRLQDGGCDCRVAENDRKQVVEVVGDAAGHPSDGLHFLRLPKLLFSLSQCIDGALVLCDVMQDDEVKAGKDIGGRAEVELPPAAVWTDDRKVAAKLSLGEK